MKIFGMLGISFALLAGLAGLIIAGPVCGWIGEAADVTREELGPRALLKKYEWFKDALAQLDKKKADIGVYGTRLKSLETAYEGVPRKDWPRTDLDHWSQWHSEVAGTKSSYNSLAAEYNSQMSKANWRFTNAGSLPKGADVVLPREVRAYVAD